MRSGSKPLPRSLTAARGPAQPCRDRYDVLPAPDGAVSPPPGLSLAALVIWDDLAPVAIGLGTLKPSDAYAFGHLCTMTAAIQATWREPPPAPAAYVAQWRMMLELFGLAGEKSRLIAKTPGRSPENPFNNNGKRS